MKQLILAILFFLYSFIVVGQTQKRTDSLLRNIASKTVSDSVKISSMYDIAADYLYNDVEKSKKYLDDLYTFSKNKKLNFGLFYYYYGKAYTNYIKGNYSKAIKLNDTAIYYAKLMHNKALQFDSYQFYSQIYINTGDDKKALENVNQAIILAEEIKNTEMLSNARFVLGNYYFEKNLLELALKEYQKVDKIMLAYQPIHFGLGATYINIARIYIKLNNLDKAKEYTTKATKIYKKLKYTKGNMYTTSLNALIDIAEKKYKRAIDSLLIVKKYYKSINDSFEEMEKTYLLGKAYGALNNTNTASKYLEESIRIAKNIDSLALLTALTNANEVYNTIKNYTKSINYGQEALTIASKKQKIDLISKNYYALAQSQKEVYNYKKALRNLENYIIYKDSTEQLQNQKRLIALETQYQAEKKEQQINLLKTENKLIKQQKSNERNLLLLGISIITLISILLFILYKNRQKTNKKLRELDNFKSKMFNNLSHEFRTPLTVIQGLSEKLEKQLTHYNDKENVQIIHKNASLLNEQLKQILAIAALEKSNLKPNNKKGDIVNFIKMLTHLFSSYAKSNAQNIYFKSNAKSILMDFDADKIQAILQNLISNALKFNKKGGVITVRANQQENYLLLQVEDTGIGIEKENLSKIFDRFYTSSSETNTEGTGIGLAYVKELVELAKGKITVESTINQGTTFTITLPITRSAEIPETPIIPKLPFVYRNTNTKTTAKTKPKAIKNSAKKVVLVVEDNKDIQRYYKQILGDTFNLIKAYNGKEAQEKLNKKEVDLILCDLAMPEMNGFEFSKQLKQIPELSHIPLIIVSANVSVEAKTQSYNLGIDAYLTKPFKEAELLSVIANLFKKQQQRTAYFSKLLELKTAKKSEEIRSVEVNFVKQIQECALEKVVYTTEELAQKLAMSRSKLNKKINTLTGMSIANYIKHIKMEKAKELLKNTNLQVNEIAYQIGYEEASLFTKVFKKTTGQTPTNYRQTNR